MKRALFPVLAALLLFLAACGSQDPVQTSGTPAATLPETPAASTASTLLPGESTAPSVPGTSVPVTPPGTAAPTQPPETVPPTQPPETVPPTQPPETAPPTQPPETDPLPSQPESVRTTVNPDGSTVIKTFSPEGLVLSENCISAVGFPRYSRTYTYFPGTETVQYKTEINYRSDGSQDGARKESEYYESGKLKQTFNDYINQDDYRYSYDEAGNLILKETLYSNGNLRSSVANEYYPNGNLRHTVKKNWNSSGVLSSESTEDYYESGISKTSLTSYSDGRVCRTEWDEKGRQVYEEWSKSSTGAVTEKTSRTYYEDGNQLKTRDFTRYNDDGSLDRHAVSEYNENNLLLQELFDFGNGTQTLYIYDEQGRTVEETETDSSTGEVLLHSQYLFQNDPDKTVLVRIERRDDSGKMLLSTEIRKNDILREVTGQTSEGWTEHTVYDEYRRQILQERFDGNEFLLRREETEYNGDSSWKYKHYYYTEWVEEDGAYKTTDNTYDDNNNCVLSISVGTDGKKETSEEDALGRDFKKTIHAADGTLLYEQLREYYDDTYKAKDYSSKEWDEAGSLISEYRRTYYESGQTESVYTFTIEEDGTKTTSEYKYTENGYETENTETKNGITVCISSNEYFPGTSTVSFSKADYWADDGSFDSSHETTYHENGFYKTRQRKYADGSAYYAEWNENGDMTLQKEWNAGGSLYKDEHRDADGRWIAYEYYESGQVKYYSERIGNYYPMTKAYTENGIMTRFTTEDKDGYYETCYYDDEDGHLDLRYIKEHSGKYDEYYDSYGRITSRSSYDQNGDYLGYTEWYYYEESGVTYVRTSIVDNTGTMISQTTEPYTAP